MSKFGNDSVDEEDEDDSDSEEADWTCIKSNIGHMNNQTLYGFKSNILTHALIIH